GVVDANRTPPAVAATQSSSEAQDTALMARDGSTVAVVAQPDPPSAGSVEVSTLPNASPATQRSADGHDTAASSSLMVNAGFGGSIAAWVQVDAPPAGSVEVASFP